VYPELVLTVVNNDVPGGIAASPLLVEIGFAEIEAAGGWIISVTAAAICDISS